MLSGIIEFGLKPRSSRSRVAFSCRVSRAEEPKEAVEDSSRQPQNGRKRGGRIVSHYWQAPTLG
jgi:hypothetical protein